MGEGKLLGVLVGPLKKLLLGGADGRRDGERTELVKREEEALLLVELSRSRSERFG